MDVEEQAILDVLPSYRIHEVHSLLEIRVHLVEHATHRLLVAKAGIGLVNAAVATALLAERFAVESLLLLGVAGALHPNLHIGDFVIAERVIQHDSICSLAHAQELMAPGQYHLSVPEDQRLSPAFPADPKLYQWATEIRKTVGLLHTGTLLSGSEFVGNAARKGALAAQHTQAMAVEMEAAGVAHIAQKLHIPFLAAKTISDRYVPGGDDVAEYLSFRRQAADHAAWMVQQILGISS